MLRPSWSAALVSQHFHASGICCPSRASTGPCWLSLAKLGRLLARGVRPLPQIRHKLA